MDYTAGSVAKQVRASVRLPGRLAWLGDVVSLPVGWKGGQADEGVEAEVFQQHGFELASFDDPDVADDAFRTILMTCFAPIGMFE